MDALYGVLLEPLDIRQQLLEGFTRLPDLILEVDQLTDRDRVALCIAAGVKVDTSWKEERGSTFLIVTTQNRCGIIKAEGKFKVFVEKKRAGEYFSIHLGELLTSGVDQ